MISDHEMYSALQADVMEERDREVRLLREALTEQVMTRAHFQRQPNGNWRREGGLGGLLFGSLSPLGVQEAIDLLAEHGVVMSFREVPLDTP